jgi:hypothetical protein
MTTKWGSILLPQGMDRVTGCRSHLGNPMQERNDRAYRHRRGGFQTRPAPTTDTTARAHNNAPKRQTLAMTRKEAQGVPILVIARRARQSIGVHLRDVLSVRAAACLSLPRPAGESAPAGAREGVHPPARSAACFSLGGCAAGRLGKVCGFAVEGCPPLPRPLPPSGARGLVWARSRRRGAVDLRRSAPRNDERGRMRAAV